MQCVPDGKWRLGLVLCLWLLLAAILRAEPAASPNEPGLKPPSPSPIELAWKLKELSKTLVEGSTALELESLEHLRELEGYRQKLQELQIELEQTRYSRDSYKSSLEAYTTAWLKADSLKEAELREATRGRDLWRVTAVLSLIAAAAAVTWSAAR